MNFPVELPYRFVAKAIELKIRAEDIEEQMVRGSGKGGQKVNKTASCVFLKHVPSGFMVKCQKHREQRANRLSAYKLLILKIEDSVKGDRSERAKKIHKLRKQKARRSRKSKEKMLKAKAHRAELKVSRRSVDL